MTIGQNLVRLAFFTGLIAAASHTFAQGGEGPPAEPVSLSTKDGVQLRATYFPGPAPRGSTQAKQTTPVVLLHDFKGTRTIFNPLVAKLQATGDQPATERPLFAVLAVDLRGHGESTKLIAPDGAQADLDAAKLSKEGLIAMAGLDMEAVRSFLVDKNDAGELNINKLCLVGSGMGASVATNWALVDWTAPPLAVGKQGQDVKAIVLISPRWSYNGLSMQDPMKFAPLKQNVAWLLICGGQDPKMKSDFDRVQKQLEKFHPIDDKNAGPSVRRGMQINRLPSSLQGDPLIKNSGNAIDDQIVKFLTDNVAAIQQPWTSRRNRLP